MKKILVLVIGMLFMVSCYGPGNHNGDIKSNDIIIIEIKYHDDQEYTWYKVGVEQNFFLNKYKTMWFKDSIGKYDVGEKLNK